jgi:hypothetical protein
MMSAVIILAVLAMGMGVTPPADWTSEMPLTVSAASPDDGQGRTAGVPSRSLDGRIGVAATAGSGRKYWMPATIRSRPSRYGSGRRSSPLTPVDRPAKDWFGQFQNLAGFREAPQFRLAENEAIVQDNFESPFAAAAKGHLDHDRRPRPQNFSRQTDGPVEIVSGDAELNRDAVLWIEHG